MFQEFNNLKEEFNEKFVNIDDAEYNGFSSKMNTANSDSESDEVQQLKVNIVIFKFYLFVVSDPQQSMYPTYLFSIFNIKQLNFY